MDLYIQGHSNRAALGDLEFYKNESSGEKILPKLEKIKFLPEGNIDDFLCVADKTLVIIDGRLYTMGIYRKNGELSSSVDISINGISGVVLEPKLVTALDIPEAGWTSLHLSNNVSIRTQGFYAINSGNLYYWGSTSTNSGLSTDERTSPFNINLTRMGTGTEYDNGWETVSSGENFSVGIREGNLYAWGVSNLTGIGLSSGTTTIPTRVGSRSDWKFISCGKTHTLAITEGGELFSWGSNLNFATGIGTSSGITLTPTRVGTEDDWEFCAAGNGVSFGIRNDGSVYSWGNSRWVGLGEQTDNIMYPTVIEDLDSERIIRTYASSPWGELFTALSSEKSRYVWGEILHLLLEESQYLAIPESFLDPNDVYSVLPDTEFSTRRSNRYGILLHTPYAVTESLNWNQLKLMYTKYTDKVTLADVFMGTVGESSVGDIVTGTPPPPESLDPIPTGDYLVANLRYNSRTVHFIEEGSTARGDNVIPFTKEPYSLDVRSYSDFNTLGGDLDLNSFQPKNVYDFCSWSGDGNKFMIIDSSSPFVTLFDTDTFEPSSIQVNISGISEGYKQNTGALNNDGSILVISGIGNLDGSPQEGGLIKIYKLVSSQYELDATIEDDPDATMRKDVPILFANNDNHLILPQIRDNVTVNNVGKIFRVYDLITHEFLDLPDATDPVGPMLEESVVYTLSRDGTRLFVLGSKGSMLTYDTTTWALLNTFTVNDWRLKADQYSLQMSYDDTIIYVCDSATLEKVSRSDVETNSSGDFEIIVKGSPDIFGLGHITPDGVYMITADPSGNNISIFNLRTYNIEKVFRKDMIDITGYASNYVGVPKPSPMLPSPTNKTPQIPTSSNAKITGGRAFGTSGHNIAGGFIDTYENFGVII